MAVITKMQEGQTMPLALAVKDDKGHPAKVDGKPAWDLAQGAENGVKLVVAEDGMSATLKAPAGSAGQARVIVTADADLGEGVRSITSECDIIISTREATSVEITPGPAVDDPDSEPHALKGGKKKPKK